LEIGSRHRVNSWHVIGCARTNQCCKNIGFLEFAIVEHEQKFASVRIEPLDRMWNPRREIPQIADTYVVDKVSPLRVDGRDARGSIRARVQPPGSSRILAPSQPSEALH